MSKRLITLLAALLVLGFVVTGCGDDESDSAGNGDTTAATVPGTDTGATTGEETATDDQTTTQDQTETDDETETDAGAGDATDTAKGGGAAAPTSRAQAVENCEKGVNAAKQLSADAKEKLTDLCEKAASGDPDDVREAAREVCKTIVEDTFPKDAPGRDQALESCDRNGQ
jgi:hypothetical protein